MIQIPTPEQLVISSFFFSLSLFSLGSNHRLPHRCRMASFVTGMSIAGCCRASLVKRSALLFPVMPACPGIQQNQKILFRTMCSISCMHGCLEDPASRACRPLAESVRITTSFLRLGIYTAILIALHTPLQRKRCTLLVAWTFLSIHYCEARLMPCLRTLTRQCRRWSSCGTESTKDSEQQGGLVTKAPEANWTILL